MTYIDLREPATPSSLHPDFEQFFAAENRRLVRSLTLMCGDQELAADCVADAFERACVRWVTVSRLDDPCGWVRRVAINRLRDAHRTLVRRDALFARLDLDAEQVCGTVPRDEDVLAVVAALSDQQRAVVALHYLDDVPLEDVASILGLSEGTVRYHLHHARKRLRTLYEASIQSTDQ